MHFAQEIDWTYSTLDNTNNNELEECYVVEVSKSFSLVSLRVEHFAKSLLNHCVRWNNSQQLNIPTTPHHSIAYPVFALPGVNGQLNP